MSEIRFDDQVVLVTGAGRGLGAAYARLLVERGASVVVHDAGVEADGSGGDSTVAKAVADEIGGVACVENLETEEGCRRTVEFALERFGRLDAVIQNAGLNIWEELEDADRSWERMRRRARKLVAEAVVCKVTRGSARTRVSQIFAGTRI